MNSFFPDLIDDWNKDLPALRFSQPAHVYNPYEYGRDAVLEYWNRFANGQRPVVFLGMNPGPWGMVQTAVPFGEVSAVKDWMGLTREVTQPASMHPARPIQGFACRRSEVSGRRLWGWIQSLHPKPEGFFDACIVHNFCPLAFLGDSGKNLTPDKFPRAERAALEAVCRKYLLRLLNFWKPVWLIGVGQFAADQLTGIEFPGATVIRIPHPSPANPAANKDWNAAVESVLSGAGVLPVIVGQS